MKKTMRRLFLESWELEIVAFVIGFCLLTYELVAARLLAPYIGSSIYVWTSVIGVIILALSFGYAFGGWLADRRTRAADVAYLLLLSASGVAITLATYAIILSAIIELLADPRLQGLAASLILFAPTSFVLGSISPYLARLKLKSLDTTGRVIAGLSAINSLGGITGTFITGFILFGYFGSNQILLVLTILLLAVSWIVAGRQEVAKRLLISSVVLLFAVLSLSPILPKKVLADIDTPSAHYRVLEVPVTDSRSLRVLTTGPGAWQSGNFTDGSSQLAFWYSQKIAEIVEQTPKHDSILILGGGAFSLPRYLAEKYPDAKITVVEIDPILPAIAEDYFYYKSPDNVTVVSQDARAFLGKNKQQYDTVIVDVFSDISIPYTLTTAEYAAALNKATHTRSQVIVNIIASTSGPCGELFGGINAAYKESFNQSAYFPNYGDKPEIRQNVIAVYGHQPLDWLNPPDGIPLKPGVSPSFTDDFTPADRLNFTCAIQ